MLIQNKGDYVRHAAGVMLVPGANHIEESAWKKFSAHPLMKVLIDKKEIVAMKGETTKDLSAEKAIALVEDTFNNSLLEEWLAADSRKTVQQAINEQLDRIRGTATPDEE